MLARPHIEFFQAQMLPWRRLPPGTARPDAEYKFLSRDIDDGACSCLIRYPAGWHREAEECLTADEEFYVLEGGLILDDISYGPDTYAFLPAGWPHRDMRVPKGAVVLNFFSRQPDFAPREKISDAHIARAIPFIDVLHMPWDVKRDDPKPAHLNRARKNLRTDPFTGERTFLSMVLPHTEPPGTHGTTERHPVVEEAYVISGSLVGPQGEMFPGAYFWRPPRIDHGPFGTRWGCVSLIRFIGGAHENISSQHEAAFDFQAPYAPVLPPEFAHLRHAHYMPPGNY